MSIKIFFSYAHEDEALLEQLKRHLKLLQLQGLISTFHYRDVNAGSEWKRITSQYLNTAGIILLLISPDFMNSDYCYSVEMKKAMALHELGKARVIPVILRPLDLQGVPFNKLTVLPTGGHPIISASWNNLDEALLDVTQGIRKAVDELSAEPVNPFITSSLSINKETTIETILSSSPRLENSAIRPLLSEGRLGFLNIRTPEGLTHVYKLDKKITGIGRSKEDDIFLEDLAVSRYHASIINLGYSNYAVRDEGSANGIKVNGKQKNAYQLYPLHEGDQILIGQTTLVFIIQTITSSNLPNHFGFLYLQTSEGLTHVYRLDKKIIRIGRSKEDDIFLKDLAVSRYHASIINLGHSNYAIRDEGSANGIKVNGKQKNAYQLCPLHEGDQILVGQTTLVFTKY